jgi:hypothetical protein
MTKGSFTSREGQIGNRPPEFEVGDLVLSRRSNNAFGKVSVCVFVRVA